jgi:hypothetical protein
MRPLSRIEVMTDRQLTELKGLHYVNVCNFANLIAALEAERAKTRAIVQVFRALAVATRECGCQGLRYCSYHERVHDAIAALEGAETK